MLPTEESRTKPTATVVKTGTVSDGERPSDLLYLDRVANFEAIYGSLSSIIVLLLWFYCSALVLIFGAEYNIVRARARAAEPSPGPGGES